MQNPSHTAVERARLVKERKNLTPKITLRSRHNQAIPAVHAFNRLTANS